MFKAGDVEFWDGNWFFNISFCFL